MVSSMATPGKIAEIYTSNTNSSGHFTSWTIAIRSQEESNLTMAVMAHEFGHVFGLGDLKTYSNRYKLMYKNCDAGTTPNVTGPTSADIWGAKIITGYHTSHTWEYVYSSGNKHLRRCTSCGGFKTQGCTPDANGYCTKCGHYVDISPNGNYDPIAALLPDPGEGRRYFPRH